MAASGLNDGCFRSERWPRQIGAFGAKFSPSVAKLPTMALEASRAVAGFGVPLAINGAIGLEENPDSTGQDAG
jgi:hypothetical protein